MGEKFKDPKAHSLAEASDSEEDDNEPVGPLEGDEPPQMPNASVAPAVNILGDKEFSRSMVDTAPTTFSDEEGTVPTLNPVERRQIKRAEQKRYSLRAREKGLLNKPP